MIFNLGHFSRLSIVKWHCNCSGGDVIGKEKVTIFSYDLLTKFNLKKRFKCVIADESHFIKNGINPTKSLLDSSQWSILQFNIFSCWF